MELCMGAKFRIMKKQKNGQYTPLMKDKITGITAGGFSFIIDGKNVPFDFEAFAIKEDNGIFTYSTGYGAFFNSFEIEDCYDSMLADIGLTRDNLTASFLASASAIDEFTIDFETADGDEVMCNCNRIGSAYMLKLIAVGFGNPGTVDFDDETVWENKELCQVSKEALNAFNTATNVLFPG